MKDFKSDSKFNGVTIFVLASNETNILRKTINEIYKNCSVDDIEKVVVVLKSNFCPSFYEIQKILEEHTYEKLQMYVQKAPNAVLCIAELPPLAEGTHFIIMSGDAEMNPASIKDFVALAKKSPEKIICAAKWHKDSLVEGYGFFHAICSRAMNLFVNILFNKSVRDPFSMFQIYPISIYQKLNFARPERFIYEYTLKALKNGIEYEEIPTVYRKRSEGKSNFNLLILIKTAIIFCATAVRIRFFSKREI